MSHELLDEISLELGRRTAERLRQQPEMLSVAQENLARWSCQNADAPALLRCYAEWRALLSRPLEEIFELLSGENQESCRLRQNSPFAGVLKPREVWEIKERFRNATRTA